MPKYRDVGKKYRDVDEKYRDVDEKYRDVDEKYRDVGKKYRDVDEKYRDVGKSDRTTHNSTSHLLGSTWQLASYLAKLCLCVPLRFKKPHASAFNDEMSEISDYVRDDINAIALLLLRVLD